jgi:AcrR family transcriptional regulator
MSDETLWAARLGATKQSLFHHFHNRQELRRCRAAPTPRTFAAWIR